MVAGLSRVNVNCIRFIGRCAVFGELERRIDEGVGRRWDTQTPGQAEGLTEMPD